MSRRFHKKSRNGCKECKRRHIRCAQSRPECSNCVSAELRCSFLGENQPTGLRLTYERPSPSTSTSQSCSRTTTPPPKISTTPSTDAYDVNSVHLKLFQTLSDRDFLRGSSVDLPDAIPLQLYLRHAFETPYLMHMVLAASALYLSVTCDKASKSFYRDMAIGLQTRALSLFNISHPDLNLTSKNAVPIFLFTSVLTVELLCEPLLHRQGDLEEFIEHFTHSLAICQGFLRLVGEARELLEPTEVGPSLEATARIMQRAEPTAPECDMLKGLISAQELDIISQDAYQKAVFLLRRVYSAQTTVAAGSEPRMVQAVWVWPLQLSSDFRLLLAARKPQALIILAHYAVLLHRMRHLWHFGSGGRYLIETISETLDPMWHCWMRFPQEVLREA